MMDTVLNQYYWMRDNYVELLTSLMILLIALQGFVRLTPTKSDDAFLERMSGYLNLVFKWLKIPNVKREDGSIMPAGAHPEKEKSDKVP